MKHDDVSLAPSAPDLSQPETRPDPQRVRAVAAAIIGNALEWFDMAIYALLAIYIGKNFFPSEDPAVGTVNALAAFGVSYLIRPLGGLVLGSYADRRGLKKGLVLTIRLMVVGTAILAFMPGYDSIGILAPLGVVLARLIQGFSAGGEFGAATSYLMAQDPGRRGFFGSFQFASQGLGTLLASLFVAVLTAVLSPEDMVAWGWRIPFVFGLLVGPVGYFVRRHVEEIPVGGDAHGRAHAPVKEIFRTQKAAVLIAGGAMVISTAVNFMIQYLPTLGIQTLGLPSSSSFWSLVVTGVILTFATPLIGHLADRVGRIRLMLPAAAVIGVVVVPLFLWLDLARSVGALLLCMVVLGALKSLYFAALPSVMGDVFPAATRATGLALSYNTAVAVFGGFTPMIAAWLIGTTGQAISPGLYLVALAVISILSLLAAAKFRAIR
ncbi:MFS transporter [Arthrobacter woluwensis]|uniref:MFS transporter n=1 Tax=Arthrobacter woluwensis TaxID=156980 RepID=UPI003819C3B3